MRNLEFGFLIVCFLNTIHFIQSQYIVDCSELEYNVDFKGNDREKVLKY